MATWSAAQVRNAALTKLGIVGQNETALADDADDVDEAWISLHDQLRKEGLAPFAIGAIPTWAQQPCRKRLAGEVAREFGIPLGPGEREPGDNLKRDGTRDLAKQNATSKAPVPVRLLDYL